MSVDGGRREVKAGSTLCIQGGATGTGWGVGTLRMGGAFPERERERTHGDTWQCPTE